MKNRDIEVSYREISRLMAEGVGSPIICNGSIDIVADGVTYTCKDIPELPGIPDIDIPAIPDIPDWELCFNSNYGDDIR